MRASEDRVKKIVGLLVCVAIIEQNIEIVASDRVAQEKAKVASQEEEATLVVRTVGG